MTQRHWSQPGLELLKREAGSKLTQPGVSAAPTRHSLTVRAVKEQRWDQTSTREFKQHVQEDTRRGSLGSLQRPSRWSSPETSKVRSDFLIILMRQHNCFSLSRILPPCGWWSRGCRTSPQTEILGCCCWSSWCRTCSLRVTYRWLWTLARKRSLPKRDEKQSARDQFWIKIW